MAWCDVVLVWGGAGCDRVGAVLLGEVKWLGGGEACRGPNKGVVACRGALLFAGLPLRLDRKARVERRRRLHLSLVSGEWCVVCGVW